MRAVMLCFVYVACISCVLHARIDANSIEPTHIAQKDYLSAFNNVFAVRSKEYDVFRIFGDVAQFLPAVSAVYALSLRDMRGFRQQVVGFIAVVISTYAIKYALHAGAPFSDAIASFAKRPDSHSFEGFPSGHTASAFAAAGFLQKRYGVKLGLPAVIIASAVGASRIHANRHTLLQVISGALLGFVLSFLLASRRTPSSSLSNRGKLLDKGGQNILWRCMGGISMGHLHYAPHSSYALWLTCIECIILGLYV